VKAVVQRVTSAAVAALDGDTWRGVAQIGPGLLVLVGIERGDGPADISFIAGKVRDLRLFDDPVAGRHFDRSVGDVGGAVLVISQFTLAADCRKGRRPSFDAAAAPELAKPLYEQVVRELQTAGLDVSTGQFQAMMQVTLVNDGPVTIVLDSRRSS
jgi:D-tyrosyl-tRNA(Tyr) deacylase